MPSKNHKMLPSSVKHIILLVKFYQIKSNILDYNSLGNVGSVLNTQLDIIVISSSTKSSGYGQISIREF